MQLSIVIPIYNGTKYIERCILSIISQDIEDYEILLIDDGSIDESLTVSNELSEKYRQIKVLPKENGGVSSARNYGIANAKGKYIMFVDIDDLILPDSLKYAVNTVKNDDTGADFFIFGVKRVSRNGTVTVISPKNNTYNKHNKLGYLKRADGVLAGAPWGKIFRKSFIVDNSLLFDENIKLFEDICFNTKAIEKSNLFITSDIVLYCYELNMTSATAKFNGEKFINDILNYYNTTVDSVSNIINSSDKKAEVLTDADEIISHAKETVIFDTLYEIYNIYRNKEFSSAEKYSRLKRMVSFMRTFDLNWDKCFNRSFPRFFKRTYKCHPRLAHMMLLTVFKIKR